MGEEIIEKDLDLKDMKLQDNVQESVKESMNEISMCMLIDTILQQSSVNSDLHKIFKKLKQHLTSVASNETSNRIDKISNVALIANNIKGYLRTFNYNNLHEVLDELSQDVQNQICSLFGLENGFTYLHDIRFKGVVNVCKLALYMKYAKYASDGFTALYTRPPVIYVSAAAPSDFGKELRTQLGLPQSSVCKVPCNTMYGSPYTMDVAAFDRLLTDDVSCGKTPLILIAYAGTPFTGHTDNLSRLREICTQSGVWLHIEGDSLAILALPSNPPSISSSTSADSLTLNFPDWLACFNIPYCTFYKTSNPVMAEHSSLVSKEIVDKLSCLPLWSILRTIGLEDIRNILINASEFAQQLSHRLDMVSGIKRLEQSNVVSPVVVFRYKASPSVSYSSSSSLEYEDDETTSDKLTKNQQSLSSKNIDISPKLSDAFNNLLAKTLEENQSKVRINVKQVSREGSCITFNPLQSAQAFATNKDDIDKFVAQIEQEIIKMDSTLIARSLFEEYFQTVKDIVLINVSDLPVIGAFQCIPKYWKVKDLSNLSDSKKREANDLNIKMTDRLSQEFANLNHGKSSSGQVFVQIGLVDDSFDVNALAERVVAIAEELEDNSKFLETISDAVQAKIHEAEAGLQKESEEKFFEEGVLRNVPVFGSVYNWLSPPPEKETRGVVGRAFNLASGKLESTEKTYKYKMQLQNDDDDDDNDEVNENQLNISSSNNSQISPNEDSSNAEKFNESKNEPENIENSAIEEGEKFESNDEDGENKIDEGTEMKESDV